MFAGLDLGFIFLAHVTTWKFVLEKHRDLTSTHPPTPISPGFKSPTYNMFRHEVSLCNNWSNSDVITTVMMWCEMRTTVMMWCEMRSIAM